jgi:hypothetical protein
VPFVAAVRLVVVTDNPAALTAIDSCAEAVCAGDPLSLTPTVNVNDPVVVGVPVITPALDRLRPAGRLPEAIDQV